MKSRTLISSSDGEIGGIYGYELDAMTKYAPIFARAVKVPLADLPRFRLDFARIVIIYDRRDSPYNYLIPMSILAIGRRIVAKREVRVFLINNGSVANSGHLLSHIWSIHEEQIYYRVSVPMVFYEFKKFGGRRLDYGEKRTNDGFLSPDWGALQNLVRHLH